MTIPYVAGWGDNLAQSLPNLASGLAHVINPQMDQQNALKAAMIKDPTILQHYASIERNNPGTLARLGFGQKFGDIVGSIGESEEETLAKKKTKADIARTEAETSESGVRSKEYTAQTNLADAQTRLAQVHLDDLARDNKAKADLFKAVPDLSNQNISKLAADYSIGKIDNPQVIARIQADPNYGPIFEGMTKNIIERAKMALSKRQMDRLDQNEKMVAIKYALTNQREADQRVTQLETLQRKYGSMDQKSLMANRLLAQQKPDSPMAQELAAYDQMVANGGAEIENARKDATAARALSLGAFKASPEFKAILDQQDAIEAKNKKTQDLVNSADREDPNVTAAREAIRAVGLDVVKKKSDLWKKLSLPQQKAAMYQSPYEDDSTNNTVPNRPAPPHLETPPLKQTARGPGQGSSISGSKLSPFEAMQQQMRDVIAGRTPGDYSDSIDPIYDQDVPMVQNLSPRLNQTGNAFPGNNQPIINPQSPVGSIMNGKP